jgi:hypothetical protein
MYSELDQLVKNQPEAMSDKVYAFSFQMHDVDHRKKAR